MGDVFIDIHNATLINKSLVENSFNKVKREHDEETGKALVKVAEFIEKSKILPPSHYLITLIKN